MYGTTLRIFDPGIGGWHIIWSDPLNQDYSRQIGRAEGKDIVQIGDDLRGLKTRWRFTEITADSFHWIGEENFRERSWRITYEHLPAEPGRRALERWVAGSAREARAWPGPTAAQGREQTPAVLTSGGRS